MLSARIKELRLAAGLTHEALAFRAGVSVATVQRTEAGKHDPSLSTITSLATALDVPLAELLDAEQTAS